MPTAMEEITSTPDDQGNRPAKAPPLDSRLLDLLLPKTSDLLFLAVFLTIVFTSYSAHLLYDNSIGWHIRNGDFILATGSIPRVDHFSYTMAGQPWYSWEWLFDVVLSLVHRLDGLAGVIVLSAVLIALTLKLLYEHLLRSSHSVLSAAVLVFLVGEASSVHYLARPHLVTWLFTLIFLIALERYRSGLPVRLWLLPVGMLFWVNLHGGFIAGFALILVYVLDRIWTMVTAESGQVKRAARNGARPLIAVLGGCFVATFFNPYGYRLHVHIWNFLRDSYLLNHFNEFNSPNFHNSAPRYFEVLLFLTILSVAFSSSARSFRALLLTLMALHAALFSVRNLPIASVMIAVVIAPALADVFRLASRLPAAGQRLRNVFSGVLDFSARLEAIEDRLAGNLLPFLAVLVTVFILATHSLTIEFSPRRVPVNAVNFIQKQGIHDHLATLDTWGGYMIYRLYPEFHVFMDDRGDLFKEQFVNDYLSLIYANWDWKKTIDKYSIQWVLVPPDVPLFSVLRNRRDWKVVYDDGFAILFEHVEDTAPKPAIAGQIRK